MTETLPKLYLNMILGDFESPDIVKRSIESVKDHVDGIYVTVTFKNKAVKNSKLVKLLHSLGANVSFFKWTKSFADARQYALEQVPKGTHNYIYWQDADDVLYNAQNLRTVLKEADAQNLSAVYFDYWYQVEVDEKTNEIREILVKHKRERIVRNDDTWKWVGTLHETLIEQKQENLTRYYRPECYVVHLTDNQRLDHNIDRNIEILEKTIKDEKGKDPRTIISLAKSYFDKGKMTDDLGQRKLYLDLALNLFHEYLEGSGAVGSDSYREGSGWKEERATAWGHVAEIALLSSRPDVSIGAYQSAIDEAPWFPNYYVDMAAAYIALGDYKKAKHWLNVATVIPEPKTTIITFPRQLKTSALEVSFQINLHEGKLDYALADTEKLMEIMPKDEELKKRHLTVLSLRDFNKACQSVVFLGKYLENVGEADKVQHLVRSLSKDMQKEKFAAEMRHRFLPKRIWAEDEVAILCGPGFEEWTPESMKTGLGGSEEAVVHLANQLTQKGWKVTVYANPGDKAGNFDGVQYEQWYNLNPLDTFNSLILWRGIGFVDINPKAKFIMLWLHDVPNNPDFTEERVEKIDKIAVLSEYHKSLLRLHKDGKFLPMPEEKVFLTANGLPEGLTPSNVKRNPHRMIYASSPDRGLVYLLKNWKKVREKVADAELHVFYGFDVYDAIHRDNPARQKWKEQVIKLMNQPGITYHGRVGHEKLHEEYSKSGVWSYPTDFTEISCISAMKAQALGAIPVTTTLAALDETVKNGVKLDADITLPEVQEEYVEALVKILTDEKGQEEMRKGMTEWAQSYFSWKNVASLWDELMRIKVQNPEKRLEIK